MKNRIKEKVLRFMNRLLDQRHSFGTKVVSGVLVVALIFSFVVLPALADETEGEPETVSEELMEETASDETDVEKADGEEAAEEEAAAEEETEKTDGPSADEPYAEEPSADEPQEMEATPEPSVSDETQASEEKSGEDGEAEEKKQDETKDPETTVSGAENPKKTKTASQRAAADVPKPQAHIEIESGSKEWTYLDNDGGATLSVVLDNYELDYTVSYQWYYSNTKIDNAEGRKYSITKTNDAGTFEFYCEVTYKKDGASSTAKTDSVPITIKKRPPEGTDFDCTFKKKTEYYYTGKDEKAQLVVTPRDDIEGMGDITVWTINDGQQVPFKLVGTYEVWLHLDEGKNYQAVDKLPLRHSDAVTTVTVTMKRLRVSTKGYSFKPGAIKGNRIEGLQSYRSEVSILPLNGYKIAVAEEGIADDALTFTDALVFSGTSLSNMAPEKIILQSQVDGALTEPMPILDADKFCIDMESPDGDLVLSVKGSPDTLLNPEHLFFKDSFTASVENVSDRGGSADEDIKCWMTTGKSGASAPAFNTRTWTETRILEIKDPSDCVVYAVLEDQAGNRKEIQSNRLVVDTVSPTIQCGTRNVKEKYIADEKSFTISDDNLRRVTVTGGGDSKVYQSGSDFQGTVMDLLLKSPKNDGESYTYTIVAEDASGNTLSQNITLQNPNNDVVVTPVDYDVYYGYTPKAQPLVLEKKGSYTDGIEDPVVEKVTPIQSQDGKTYFTYDEDTQSVKPVAGLPARDEAYTGVFRVDYRGLETESSTTVTCSLLVKKIPLKASYEGQSVYYHTNASKVDFISHLKIEGEFAPGESLDYLVKNASSTGFEMPEIGVDERNIVESKNLLPTGGGALNYEFTEWEGGLLKVEDRRELPYETTDPIGKNNWYTSASLALISNDRYYISEDETFSSFSADNAIRVLDAGETHTSKEGKEIRFYVMDKETEEISCEMVRNIKIDSTAPVIAEDGGISISDKLWKEVLSTITFGIFFNETKAVRISGISDDESDIEAIEYYLSNVSITGDQLKGLQSGDDPYTGWAEYDDGFDLEPSEIEQAVICAKITNKAGLSTYITSDGFVFDNKVPDIDVKDEGVYVADEKVITISDRTLKSAKLYDSTDVPVDLEINYSEEDGLRKAVTVINTSDWQPGESRTYTIIAADDAGNMNDIVFTIVKPIYGIEAHELTIPERAYGYEKLPTAAVTWSNTPEANADATIFNVQLTDRDHFQVMESAGGYAIAPMHGLSAGTYSTDVVLTYNGGKTTATTCSFTVTKATLNARYMGQSVYYHMMPDFDNTIVITGFVNGDTAETAAGYEAPVINYTETADETAVLVPKGGKADNYTFTYTEGILIVNRRVAETGKEGQYQVKGTVTDTGWYKSDITITPSQGFEIALDENAEKTKDELVITKDTDAGEQKFYLMNKQTGEIYEKTDFEYKKDVVKPSIAGIDNGSTYVANNREVVVNDDYLSSVTVNGEAKQVVSGESKFKLSATQKAKIYVITATDRAGNMSSARVTMEQPSELPVTEAGTPAEITTDNPSETDPGTVKKDVKVESGAPSTSITSNAKDVAESTLSDAEKLAVDNGSSAEIQLRVKNVDRSVDQKDKELIIANLGDYTMGTYLDITLWKTVGNSSEKQVHNINSPISVTVTVPKELRLNTSGRTRTYAVLRVHNGAVSFLPDRDLVANTVTFSTNRFSTYALVYKDTAKSSGSTQTTKESSNGSGGSSGSKTAGNTSTGSGGASTLRTTAVSRASVPATFRYEPAMGDSAPLMLVTVILMIALVGIIAVIIIRKRKDQ